MVLSIIKQWAISIEISRIIYTKQWRCRDILNKKVLKIIYKLRLEVVEVRKIKYALKNDYNGIYLLRTAIKENIQTLKEKVYDKHFGMGRKFNRLYGIDVQRL